MHLSRLPETPICQDRIVNPADVIAKDPEVIIGSWCGRAVKTDWISKRDGGTS